MPELPEVEVVRQGLKVAGRGAEAWACPECNATTFRAAVIGTTRTAEGGPYKRLDPVFTAKQINPGTFDPVLKKVETVQLTDVKPDTQPGTMVYEPGHPDANADGYLQYPNVNIVEEMTNMISASRAYEAGISTVQATERMGSSALDLGRS